MCFFKEYLNADESQYWIEEMRGKSFSSSMNFSDTVSADLIAQLGDNARLGRLKFLNRHGLDESGAAMKLIAMGGRGVTIFEMTDDFQAVVAWDSGDEIEAKHMEMDPNGTKAIFNPVQVDAGDQLVTDGADGRSDDKGVETETVELGKCGGQRAMPLCSM